MLSLRIITYLASAIILFGIGIFVLLNNSKSKSNRWLFSFVLTVIIWILALNFADNFNNQQLAFQASRVAFGIGGFIFFSLYQFTRYFPRDISQKTRFLSILLFISAVMFLAVSPTSLAVKEVKILSYGAEVIGGALYPYLAGNVLIAFGLCIYNLVRSRKVANAVEKQQLRFMSFGLVAFAFVALMTNLFLVIIGFSELGFLGPPSVLLFVLPTSYAIIRHRLFDIRAVVARSVAYLFSVLSFAFVYGFLAYGVAQNLLLKTILTTERSQQIFNIILAVILAFTFPTIRRFFEKITDRIFYRDRYDPQHLMSSIGRILATEIALEPLTTKVIRVLEDEMRLADANIVVLGKKGEDGEKDSETETDIYYQTHGAKKHQDYRIEDLRSIRIPVIITDELASSDERQILEQHHIRAAFALKTRESQVGYLLLGDKRSGDIYSDQDIQTLRIIADELAVAIQNARAYTEIQRFNVTLREKIDQATHDLKHANSELKALDKAKDEFISMASHQLRTPLTAVRGYTSMVMDGDFGDVSAEQKDTLKQAFDAATRMTRLVDDLLNVSRIQSGKFRIERAPVDLNKVLPEEISLLDTTAKTKKVSITFNPPKTPVPSILIDEGKTRQCLMNLMDNAIYYSSTAAGGGKVQVYLENDADNVIFRVVDNGIGVPKAQQAKLFNKFYRAPNAQKTRPDGTGLGLFLVGKVVSSQGGEIIFESEEGKGSTFGFKLPIKAAGEGVDANGKPVTVVDEVAPTSATPAVPSPAANTQAKAPQEPAKVQPSRSTSGPKEVVVSANKADSVHEESKKASA